MQLFALLVLAPGVLGCLNPGSNSCASFIKNQAGTASAFCATFTQSVVTATAALPAWATNCQNKPKLISAECSCHYTGGTGPVTTARPVTTTFVTVQTTSRPAFPTTASSGGGGSCSPTSVNQLTGYGQGTTGGGSGAGVTVNSCSALTAAVANAGVIRISGLLSGCGIVNLKSGTTVLGVGSGSGLTNGGFRVRKASNVILRNLKLTVAPKGGDLVALDEATNVWIDHNDFTSVGMIGGKDDYDGLLDITHASDSVTVSWNTFRNHWKGSLIGHSDNNGGEDTGKLHVTYHHNLFANVNSRTPSLRFGTAHIYSSCFEDIPTSGINSRMGAIARVENNSFTNVNLAIVTDLDSDEAGRAQELNNLFVNSPTRITQTGTLSLPYSYTQDAASCVCALIKSQAGTGKV